MTCSAGGDHSSVLEEGPSAGAVSNRQLSCHVEDMTYESESDTASNSETCLKGIDLYSLGE